MINRLRRQKCPMCTCTGSLKLRVYNTFGVVALGPVVARAGLSENKVVRSEDLSVRSGSDRVHGAGLQVDEDGPGHVLAACNA